MNGDILRRAKARLDRLALYPAPVDLEGVRAFVAPWVFAIPGFRRFRGTRDRTRYRANFYEREARYAVEATRSALDVG